MTDVLDQQLRETLNERAAQFDHSASARLRAIDYRPRRLRIPSRPAVGITGLAGATAAVAAVVALGSGAAPAFAGWRATPSPPFPGQLAAAAQVCGSGDGTAVLTDTRGPYTASLYAQPNGGQLCISGNQVSASQEWSSSSPGSLAAGQVQLQGTGMRDSSGDALTLVYGRVGSGVTAVTVDRSDGSSVQATVTNGWYLAWWPGSTSAKTAEVTSASGTTDQSFPAAPNLSAPSCPAGNGCAGGYSFNSAGPGGSSGQGQTGSHGSSVVSGSMSSGGPAPAGTGNSGSGSSATGNSGSGSSATGNSGQ